jgi:hypothetical protein
MSGVDPLFALDRAARQGRVEDGDLVLLIVAGTGYTDPPRRRVMTWDDCETTVAAALRRTGMKEPEVDWRRGSAVGVASAEFSTRRPAGELDAVGYRMVDTDQRVAGQPHRRDPATGCDALRASPSQGGGSVGVVGSRQLPGQLGVCEDTAGSSTIRSLTELAVSRQAPSCLPFNASSTQPRAARRPPPSAQPYFSV